MPRTALHRLRAAAVAALMAAVAIVGVTVATPGSAQAYGTVYIGYRYTNTCLTSPDNAHLVTAKTCVGPSNQWSVEYHADYSGSIIRHLPSGKCLAQFDYTWTYLAPCNWAHSGHRWHVFQVYAGTTITYYIYNIGVQRYLVSDHSNQVYLTEDGPKAKAYWTVSR